MRIAARERIEEQMPAVARLFSVSASSVVGVGRRRPARLQSRASAGGAQLRPSIIAPRPRAQLLDHRVGERRRQRHSPAVPARHGAAAAPSPAAHRPSGRACARTPAACRRTRSCRRASAARRNFPRRRRASAPRGAGPYCTSTLASLTMVPMLSRWRSAIRRSATRQTPSAPGPTRRYSG